MTFWDWLNLNPVWFIVIILACGWAVEGIIRALRSAPRTARKAEDKSNG